MQECTKVPCNSVLGPVLSQNQLLGIPSAHTNALLYPFNNKIMPRCPHHYHINAHIPIQSSGDVMLFWQETHAHVPKCASGNPLLRVCLLVQPCSNYFNGIGDSDPGCILWHSPPGTLACPHIKLARIMISWNTTIDNNLEYTKLRVKMRINYDQLLLTWTVTTTLQKHYSIKIDILVEVTLRSSFFILHSAKQFLFGITQFYTVLIWHYTKFSG